MLPNLYSCTEVLGSNGSKHNQEIGNSALDRPFGCFGHLAYWQR